MKYLIQCTKCDNWIWIRGSFDYETNALELDDNDSNWEEACQHISEGDYIIKEEEILIEDV